MTEQLLTERQLVINLIFKPVEPNGKLREAESEVFSAFLGEILKEIEAEEQLILDEEKAKKK